MPAERIFVHAYRRRIETGQHDPLQCGIVPQVIAKRRYGNCGGGLDGKAVGARRDGGKGNGGEIVLLSQQHAATIGASQKAGLTVTASSPDRPHSMHDIPGLEVVAPCQPRLAGWTAANAAAGGEQVRSGGPMNGPVDAATAKQRRIGGIDDGVHIQRRDVGLDDLDAMRHGNSVVTRLQQP